MKFENVSFPSKKGSILQSKINPSETQITQRDGMKHTANTLQIQSKSSIPMEATSFKPQGIPKPTTEKCKKEPKSWRMTGFFQWKINRWATNWQKGNGVL